MGASSFQGHNAALHQRLLAHPVRMVAIDVDGTLLRSDKRMSVKVVHAVRRVHEAGVRVVLASARPPRSTREIYELLRLDTLQINYNGALIYDPTRKKNVRHEPLAPTLAKRLINFTRKVDPKVYVSLEILDRWYTDHFDETMPTETSRQFAPDFVGPLEAFLRVPVTKVMFLAPPERMAVIRDAVEKRFAREVSLAVSDDHLLQVVNRAVDKAYGVAFVAEHYGIPQASVMAIGDAPNDTGMLRWAGLGVAMNNGWPSVRKAADAVVPSNDQDGVAYALNEFILYRLEDQGDDDASLPL